MHPDLDATAVEQIKKSYFNMLAFFLSKEQIKSSHVRCLLRWGLQLSLDQFEVSKAVLDRLHYAQPKSKLERLETIYHLVYLINQDEIIEDVELEVAAVYAEELGFPGTVATDLFKSIATATDDGISPREWRREVEEFLRMHNL